MSSRTIRVLLLIGLLAVQIGLIGCSDDRPPMSHPTRPGRVPAAPK